MPRKLRYEIDLKSYETTSDLPSMRSVSADDLAALAHLMLDAYTGTIDYDDEDLDDAMAEVSQFLTSETAVLNRSFVVEEAEKVVSGILVSLEDGAPFIGYVMTVPTHKNRGLARDVTRGALNSLKNDGYGSVTLYITEGNTASEALFHSIGAVRVDD